VPATVTLWMGSERMATANTDYIVFAGRRFRTPLGAAPVAEGADRLGLTDYSLLAPTDPITGAGGGIASMPEFTPTSFYMPPGTTIPRYLGADSGSHISPVIVGAVVIGGSSGITIGSVISGIAAILAGIGIGEGIHS
jgi:hypothetical protein